MLTRSFRIKKLGPTFYNVGQIFIETVLIKHFVAANSVKDPLNHGAVQRRTCRVSTSISPFHLE